MQFAHLGWKSADGDLGSCSYTWAKVLQQLDALVTRGERNPVFTKRGSTD